MTRHGIPEETLPRAALGLAARSAAGAPRRDGHAARCSDGDELELRDRTLRVLHRPGPLALGHRLPRRRAPHAARRRSPDQAHLVQPADLAPARCAARRRRGGPRPRAPALADDLPRVAARDARDGARPRAPGSRRRRRRPRADLIDERFRMHDRRADKLHKLVAEQPRTAYELAQALWGNVAVTQAYLTLSEVLGHMDLLVADERVGGGPRRRRVVRFEAGRGTRSRSARGAPSSDAAATQLDARSHPPSGLSSSTQRARRGAPPGLRRSRAPGPCPRRARRCRARSGPARARARSAGIPGPSSSTTSSAPPAIRPSASRRPARRAARGAPSSRAGCRAASAGSPVRRRRPGRGRVRRTSRAPRGGAGCRSRIAASASSARSTGSRARPAGRPRRARAPAAARRALSACARRSRAASTAPVARFASRLVSGVRSSCPASAAKRRALSSAARCPSAATPSRASIALRSPASASTSSGPSADRHALVEVGRRRDLARPFRAAARAAPARSASARA